MRSGPCIRAARANIRVKVIRPAPPGTLRTMVILSGYYGRRRRPTMEDGDLFLRHALVREGFLTSAGDDAGVLVRRAHRPDAAQEAGVRPELGVHFDGGTKGRDVADTHEEVR